MKTYIVSDLHGSGEVYDSIMSYLERISEEELTELYINGDLIDRGFDSFRMLDDVKKRVEGKGNIKIHYLGGNHELLMYQYYKKFLLNKCEFIYDNLWFSNGGWATEGDLVCLPKEEERKYYEFVSNLKIYKKLPQVIDNKKLLLVHSQAPEEVLDECPLRIKDNNLAVQNATWKREKEYEYFLWIRGRLIEHNNLGKDGYLVINGHTPVENDKGFMINKEQNYINIDGGCAAYYCGRFKQDKVPLVEVQDGLIKVLVFNHDNEIVAGYYYDGQLTTMPKEELIEARTRLNPKLNGNGKKVRKLIKEFLG